MNKEEKYKKQRQKAQKFIFKSNFRVSTSKNLVNYGISKFREALQSGVL